MRFHSTMATLEPQKYVKARTVGTDKILLVSGRLDIDFRYHQVWANFLSYVSETSTFYNYYSGYVINYFITFLSIACSFSPSVIRFSHF